MKQRNRLAARLYARACRRFDEGITGNLPEKIAEARHLFAAAALVDPGMCDAYLSLLLVSAFSEEHPDDRLLGLDALGLLSAAALTSARFGEEQRVVNSPIQIIFSPLIFGPVQVASGEDLRLYYACELFKSGEIKLAKEWLDRVSMRNVKRYALQAKLLYLENRFEEAIVVLGPVLESPELRFDGLYLIANSLLCLARPHEAVEVVETALSGLTRHDRPYLFLSYALAGCYAFLGEWDQRREALQEIFELDPFFLDTAQQLGLDMPEGAEVTAEEAAWQEIVAVLRADSTGDDLSRAD